MRRVREGCPEQEEIVIMRVVPVGDDEEEFVPVDEELASRLIEMIESGAFDDDFEEEDDDEQPQFDLPADERTSPEQQLTRSEMRRAVARGLDSLPDDARKILILRELNGLSYAEIGKVLHLEAGTVKSRLFRARRKLCDFLLADGNLPDQYASKQTKGGADE